MKFINNEHSARTRDNINEMVRNMSHEDLVSLILGNPNLRGPVTGHAGEKFFKEFVVDVNPQFTEVFKPAENGEDCRVDLFFNYNNRRYKVQVKSISTRTIRSNGEGTAYECRVDAGYHRSIETVMANGHTIKSKCSLRGDYDILAISTYLFTGDLSSFVYMPNYLISQPTKRSGIPDEFRPLYMSTSEKLRFPLIQGTKWTTDLSSLLDDRLGVAVV